jgi:hypothetical protein
VVGLGEGEGAELLQARHRGQPALLLLLRAEHGDRPHRQPRLHAQPRPQAAVTAIELHVDEPAADRVQPRTAVPLDVLADDPQLAQPTDQRPRKLGSLPVTADDRQHLVVDEGPHAGERVDLRVGELLAQEEVVGGERLSKPRVGRGCDLRRSLSALIALAATVQELAQPGEQLGRPRVVGVHVEVAVEVEAGDEQGLVLTKLRDSAGAVAVP